MITVKLAQLPGALREFAMEDGATVSDLLDLAGSSSDGFAISVNGAAASQDTVLSDGANVILSKSAKGNA